MNSLWKIDLEVLQEFYELVAKLEKDLKKELTPKERELAFFEFMESKGIKPSGHTELNKKELLKEIASKNKTILNIDEKGYTIIKPKEEDE